MKKLSYYLCLHSVLHLKWTRNETITEMEKKTANILNKNEKIPDPAFQMYVILLW